MATDKLVYSGYYNNVYVSYYTSENISANTSTVYCSMWISVQSGWNIGPWDDFDGSYCGTTSQTFNGSIPNVSGTYTLASTRSFTANHNSDGTGTATIYWKWGVRSSWGNVWNISGSFSITLPTIPRASVPSVSPSSVDMGSSLTVNSNRKSTSFTHSSTYKFGSATGTIASTSAKFGASTTWSPPISLANQIPNATSGTGTIYLNTYNGSTAIGSQQSCSFTAKVPTNIIPTLDSFTVTPNNSLNSVVAGWGVNVQSFTKFRLRATASGIYSSTIKQFSTTCTDTQYSTNPSASSMDFTGNPTSKSGTLSFSCYAVDSRGRSSGSSSTTQYVYPYFKPSVKSFIIRRNAALPSKVDVSLDFDIADVGGRNTATIVLLYKRKTDNVWKTATDTITKGSTTILANVGESPDDEEDTRKFDQFATYEFKVRITDTIGSVSEVEGNCGTIDVLIDLPEGGRGLGIGKANEEDALEVALDSIFIGDVYIRVGNTDVPLITYIKNVMGGAYG